MGLRLLESLDEAIVLPLQLGHLEFERLPVIPVRHGLQYQAAAVPARPHPARIDDTRPRARVNSKAVERPPLDKRYQARQCTSSVCRLRFPVDDGSALGERCPHCGEATERTDGPYQTFPAPRGRPRALQLEVLLDNVRALTNVGSVFRTADGVGVGHVHLCGFSPTPEHPKLAKTALGAEHSVRWSRHPSALEAATKLVGLGHRIWVIEAGEGSVSVFDPRTRSALEAEDSPVTLVIGHEVSGVDPRIAALAQRIIFVPMQGTKGSLNVGVAFGVVAYALLHGG